MSCRLCGSRAKGRLCRDCEIEDRAEERARARKRLDQDDDDDEGEDPVPLPDGGRPTDAYQNALLSDGGRECGRRTCETPAAVTYTTWRGAIRTRCARHALADAVTGIGESRAAAILDRMSLEELVAMCDDADGTHAPPELSKADGLGPTTAASIAENVDSSPVASAIREEADETSEEEELVTDGGRVVHPGDAARGPVGVGDQTEPTCPNGSIECARPGTAPCFDCLTGGDDGA